MKKSNLILAVTAATILASCVSKKKYTELEANYNNTRSELQKTQVEKEDLEGKMAQIEMRVERYNTKIASLKTEKDGMMVSTPNGELVLSENNKNAMRKTLKDVPASKLAGATTLKDSLNIAIAHNISKNIGAQDSEDLKVSIEETVVMINIDDNLLFKDSSYRVGNDADDILARIANVVKSEPSLEILVEGHTDSRTVKGGSYIKDNWDLSTERSAAIVRRLEKKFGVAPDQLIVAGRASYDPIVANDNKENMAKNRRTQIVIMPNLDKFFAMLGNDVAVLSENEK
ncbi:MULTISPECIES: OmpA family protein [Nonlabens]|uniref:Chemotaxis protein MotB n=1 Tax=Nonlabens xylanidelens TaxID=191564 RepID=A0A2S6IH97_9FLAO|nr:OmpA family protein [Nonlabens xylanidelens]PPK93578.1 chemotaxis protein MotB [Nonlabens xylanidelens]PQJ17838.1 cell envelope biogenesis protein OmpA [Nonlabens xylanidelens]